MAGKHGSSGNLIAGIIIGLAGGLSIGVLYASTLEKKTRKLLKEQAPEAAKGI